MNDKIKLAKGIAKLAVGTSVGSVVSKLVKTHVPVTTTFDQIQVVIGASAIAGIVSDRAVDWADEKFEDTLGFVQKIAKSIEKEESSTEDESITTE